MQIIHLKCMTVLKNECSLVYPYKGSKTVIKWRAVSDDPVVCLLSTSEVDRLNPVAIMMTINKDARNSMSIISSTLVFLSE